MPALFTADIVAALMGVAVLSTTLVAGLDVLLVVVFETWVLLATGVTWLIIGFRTGKTTKTTISTIPINKTASAAQPPIMSPVLFFLGGGALGGSDLVGGTKRRCGLYGGLGDGEDGVPVGGWLNTPACLAGGGVMLGCWLNTLACLAGGGVPLGCWLNTLAGLFGEGVTATSGGGVIDAIWVPS